MLNPDDVNDELDRIGREVFSVDTLITRNSDSLDFHDVPVWAMREALKRAYRLGYRQGADLGVMS